MHIYTHAHTMSHSRCCQYRSTSHQHQSSLSTWPWMWTVKHGWYHPAQSHCALVCMCWWGYMCVSRCYCGGAWIVKMSTCCHVDFLEFLACSQDSYAGNARQLRNKGCRACMQSGDRLQQLWGGFVYLTALIYFWRLCITGMSKSICE